MKKKYMFIVIFLISIFFIMPNVVEASTILKCTYYSSSAISWQNTFDIIYANSSSYSIEYADDEWENEVNETYSINLNNTTNLTDTGGSSCPQYIYRYKVSSKVSGKKTNMTNIYYFYDYYPDLADEDDYMNIYKLQDSEVYDIDKFYEKVYSNLELTLEGWICGTNTVNHTYTNFSNNYSTQITNAMNLAAYSLYGVGSVSALPSAVQTAINNEKTSKIKDMVTETKKDYESGKISCPTNLDDADTTDENDSDASSSNSSSSSSSSSNSNSSSSSNSNGSNFTIKYSNSSSPSCGDLTLYANSSYYGASASIMDLGYKNSSDEDKTYTVTESQYIFYSQKSSSSDQYDAYCYNAGIASGIGTGGNAGSWVQLTCNRKLMSSSSTEMDILDAGIVAIIEQGITSNDYYSIEAALRMYVYYFNNLNNNEDDLEFTNGSSHLKAWSYAFSKMAYNNYDFFSSELSTLSSYVSVASKSSISNNHVVWTSLAISYRTGYSSLESSAKSLVAVGLKAAIEYAQSGSTSSESSESDDVSLIIDEPKYKNYTDTDGKYVSTVTYNFDYDGYSVGDELTLDFSCDNCSTNNVSYTLTAVIGDVEEELTSDTYKLTIDDTNTSGTLEFIIEFTASSNYNCSKKVNYTIDVTHPADDSGIAVYDVSVGTNTQHFYVYVENEESNSDEPSTDQITDSVSICDMTCEEVKAACENNNDQDACTTYNETYGGSCTECTTYFSQATCSTSTTTLDIVEGTEASSADSCDVTDDLNVLECVIDEKDLTNENDYKVTSGSSYTNVLDNPYCAVYCREEYHITLPGIQELNSGRYFTLSVTITGEKDCYTSEITDYEDFEDELDAKLEEIYDAYDDWAELKVLSELNVTGSNSSKQLTGYYNCLYISNYWQSSYYYYLDYYLFVIYDQYNYTLSSSDGTYSDFVYSIPNLYGDQYFSYSYRSYNNDSSNNGFCSYNTQFTSTLNYDVFKTSTAGTYYMDHNNKKQYIDETFGSASISCDSYSCSIVNQVDPATDYNSRNYKGQLQSAASRLNNLIKEYLEMINDYNSCSGSSVYTYNSSDLTVSNQYLNNGWSMTYNFDPEISFWYEETSYINSALKTTLETNGTSSTDASATQTYFTCSTISNDYEDCEESDGEKSTGNVAEKYYDSYQKLLCYSDGSDGYVCDSTKTSKISKVTYVKQEMGSSGSYITPTQFYTIYSSGAIVVAAEGTDIDNATVLQNGLPVGLGTVSGVYNYALQVSNLGEYYNGNTSLGRIWGAETSVVTAAIDKYEVCYTDFALTDTGLTTGTTLDITNGVYVCAYKVSCPDCPVECDPICEWSYCPNNGCDVECDDCIYTIETNISYRPITPSDTNPNDRDLGTNWNYGGTDINSITSVSTALELKAYVTTKEIYEDGESIYNVVDGVNVTTEYVNNDNVITVTMDSSMISWIQDYNDQAGDYFTSSDGTSSTLECYDYESTTSGLQENIFCYSTFLDELIEEFPDQVEGVEDRPIGNERNATNAGVGSYWTTWDSASWDITTTGSLSYYKSYNSEIGIGPSWK